MFHIAQFYKRNGIGWRDQHSGLFRIGDCDHYVYSFANPEVTESFQKIFGGKLTIASPTPRGPYGFSR